MKKTDRDQVASKDQKKLFVAPRITRSGALPVITAGSGDLGTPGTNDDDNTA